MNATAILSSIISILTAGITGTAVGIGQGLSSLVESIFLSGETLSVFGMLVVIFAGISLALGLTRWMVNFVTSLGARNS